MSEPAAPPPPPRRPRWKKILIIAGGVLGGLLLLAAILVPPIAGAVIRSKVPAALGEALAADVSLDDASFSWSGRVVLRGLRIVPRGFHDPLLQVDRVDADVALLAALGGSYAAEVDLHGLRVLVERDAAGRFNYQLPPKPPASSGSGGGGGGQPPPVRALLRVHDAELLLRDRGLESRFTLGAEAKVDTLQKPVVWSAALADPAGGRLSAKGEFDAEKKAGPLRVTLERLSAANLAAAARAFGAPALEPGGVLDGLLDYRLDGLPALSGKTDLRWTEAALRRAPLGSVALTHEGGIDAQGAGRQVLSLSVGKLVKIGASSDLRGLPDKPGAKTRLEVDVDLAPTVAWLRAAGLLRANLAAEGVVSLNGTADILPIAWDLQSSAPRVALTLDGKPVLLEGLSHRSAGSIDDAGNGRATLSMSSGRALRVELAATLADVYRAPAVEAALDVSSDLGELGGRLGALLDLKTGLEGASTLKAAIRSSADVARVDLDARTTGLAAIDAAGKRIPLDDAIELRLAGGWDRRTSTAAVEQLHATSSFATADGRGTATLGGPAVTLGASTLTLDADLAGLAAKLGVVLETPPALAGKVSLRAKAQGEKVEVDGVLAGVRFAAYGPLDATLKHEGTVDAKGEGRHVVRLASGKALTAELTAELRDGGFGARGKAESDLGALAAALPGLLELRPGTGLAGKAALDVSLGLQGEFAVDIRLDGLAAVEKGVRRPIDPRATLAAAGTWDAKTRSLQVRSFTLASTVATADAKGGFTASPLAVKPSTFSLSADLGALGALWPDLGGRVDARGSYDGSRYEATATASGLKAGTTGPIDGTLVQKGTLSFAPGGGLAIETCELKSSAVDAIVSGALRRFLEPAREGELRLAAVVRPAELGKWMPELGLGGLPIPLTATLALTPKLLTAAGTADVRRLTLATGEAKAEAMAFDVRREGDDLKATLRSALVEWIEADYALKAALQADLAVGAKGTRGTTKLANLEVVDAKKNAVKDPALTVTHDIGLAPEAYEIRTLAVESTFLKGGLTGGLRTPAGALVFEKVKGAFRYHPDRLGAVAKPWLAGGTLAGKDEKTLTLSLDGRAPSADPWAILRAVRGTMDVDLAPYTHSGVTASGKTVLSLENGVLRTSSPLDVNRGRTELTAAVDLRDAKDAKSTLDFRAKDVDANADMAPFLSSINPIFHTVNGAVAGKSTADFRLVWEGPLDPKTADWTKAAGLHLQGSGTLAVKDLSVTGSPAVAQILQVLGEGNQLSGELVGTAIRIEKGRCEYKNMTLRLARYELRFTGWVGFDKKLELMVEMPLTPGMRKRYPNLERYTGQTLFVPLEGSASHPRLDFDGAIVEALKRAAPALLEDALKRLLERRKKDK